MTDQKPRGFSDINSDGPELSCQYIDGVIKRFPESKTTMEYIRTINAQLRYDRDGYAEMYKELRAENELLDLKLNAYISGVDQLNNIWLEHGCEKSSSTCLACKAHNAVHGRIDKSLRGADEK